MVSLSLVQQSQTRFHLSYNLSTPVTDLARLQRAMENIFDNWALDRVGEIITRCENAYADTEELSFPLTDQSSQTISGDITRTTTERDRLSNNLRNRVYFNETQQLALALGVRNYRDPEQAGNAYLVEEGLYLNSIPGAQGDRGSLWFSKAGAPTDGEFDENKNDLCIDTLTGDLYQVLGDPTPTWTLIDNIQGEQGTRGSLTYFSNGPPTNGQFNENVGDTCTDVLTGDQYEKTDNTTWTFRLNIKGPSGTNGSFEAWTNSSSYVVPNTPTALILDTLLNDSDPTDLFDYDNTTGICTINSSNVRVEAVAVINVDITGADMQIEGHWEYSTDGGSNWDVNLLGRVSYSPSNGDSIAITSALITVLDTGNLLRFIVSRTSGTGLATAQPEDAAIYFSDSLGGEPGPAGDKGDKGDKGDPGSVTATSQLQLNWITTPTNNVPNQTWFYAKNDSKLYFIPFGGTETEVGAGSGGGGAGINLIVAAAVG